MKNQNKLPENLSYLELVRKELSQLPPDELDEMTNTDSLVDALKKRIEGLSNDKADELLANDLEELTIWLEDKKDSELACHYIYGFLLGTDAEALCSESEPEPEHYVHAEFPEGFSAKRENIHLSATKEKLLISITPCNAEMYEHLINQFTIPAPKINVPGSPKIDYEQKFSEIIFDKVTGYKRLYVQSAPLFWKSVNYLLKVPGGYVFAMVDGKGKDFDEIPLESFLGTIDIKSEL